VIGARHPWVAFQFDEAMNTFGWYVENKLEERDKKWKRKWSLKQIMNGDSWYGGNNGNTLILMFLASTSNEMVM
jgi:hypothetical protein